MEKCVGGVFCFVLFFYTKTAASACRTSGHSFVHWAFLWCRLISHVHGQDRIKEVCSCKSWCLTRWVGWLFRVRVFVLSWSTWHARVEVLCVAKAKNVYVKWTSRTGSWYTYTVCACVCVWAFFSLSFPQTCSFLFHFFIMNCRSVIKPVSLSVSRVRSLSPPTHTHSHSLRAIGRKVSQAYATVLPRWEIMLGHYVRLSLCVCVCVGCFLFVLWFEHLITPTVEVLGYTVRVL